MPRPAIAQISEAVPLVVARRVPDADPAGEVGLEAGGLVGDLPRPVAEEVAGLR